jgi:serine acetyltransferase
VKTTVADFVLCGLAIAALVAASLAVVLLGIRPFSRALTGDYHVIVDFLTLLLCYGVLSAALLRILLAIRPIVPGEYAMDAPVFGYWKVLTIIYRLGQKALLPFTPEFVRPLVVRLFGARVGHDVAIGGTIDDPYLISLGDRVVIGNHALVSGSVINNGRVVLGHVSIGSDATVGANAIVLPGAEIGEGALVASASVVIAATRIPAGEMWRGNPARKWQ